MEIINVLLIEDNPGDVLLIKEMLLESKTKKKYKIEVTPSFYKGMSRLKKGGIDVVLLDLSLPDSFGFETFFKLHDSFQKIPIILFTGTPDDDLAENVMETGAQDYIVKGSITAELLEKSLIHAIERNKLVVKLKQTSQVLADTEAMFQAVFYNSAIGICVADIRGNIVNANPAILKMLGYSEEELLAKNLSDISIEEDKIANEKLFNELVYAKRDNYRMRRKYTCKDGSIIWCSVASSAIRDFHGKAQFVINMVENITHGSN
ncbi:MAG: PAS domain S-box protein [Bacteroidota bacterium]